MERLQLLIEENLLETIIVLLIVLFFFKYKYLSSLIDLQQRQRGNTNVLFIDDSREYQNWKNQNHLRK